MGLQRSRTLALRSVRIALRSLAALIAVGLMTCAMAQPAYEAHFRHLTMRDGLPHDAVLSMVNDRQGFLWIGTEDGLARFDGTSIISFHHDRKAPGSIANNYVAHLAVDDEGGIWCATRNGASRYDPTQETFRTVRSVADNDTTLLAPSIVELHVDTENNIWVCSWEGLCMIEAGGSRVQRFPDQTTWFTDKRAVSAYRDGQGQLWVGTLGGLYRIDPKLRSAEPILIDCPLPKDASGLQVTDIKEDNNGILWLSTWGSGLVRYDPRTSQAKCYLPQPARIGDGSANICTQTLSTSYPGEEHLLWVSSVSAGLLLFDKNTGAFSRFAATDPGSSTFITNDVRNLHDNGTGELFVGTGQGILVLSRSRQLFRNLMLTGMGPQPCLSSVLACYEDPADNGGTLWLGTWTCGTYVLDRRSTAMTKVEELSGTHPNGEAVQARFFHRDARNGIYAGMSNGLFHKNERTHHWQRVAPRAADGSLVDIGAPYSMAQGPDGGLIIAASGGLVFMDTRTNLAERVDLDALTAAKSHGGHTRLGGVAGFIERPNGVYWMLCDRRNLVRFDRTRNLVYLFKHDAANSTSFPAGHTLYDIVQDEHGHAWISTEAGLIAFDANTSAPAFKQIGRAEGLPSEILGGMAVDPRGRLWIGTHKGLAVLHPSTGAVRTCTGADGLLQQHVTRVFVGNTTGDVIVLSDAALQVVDLDVFDQHRSKARILLTDIRVLNQPFRAIGAPFAHERIDLTHDQKEFSFAFVAIDMSSAEPVAYDYMLEGFNQEWVANGRTNTASFMNLPGGTYRFLVRARSTDGTVSEPHQLITVVVHPPFWRKGWFFGSIVLVLIGAVMLYNRLRLRALQRRNAELERSVHLRTAELRVQKERAVQSERAKQQFLANMSHEIRTPMNAIMGMTGILKRSPHSPEQKTYLNAIAQSSENLLVILNDILDLSKLEAGRIEFERIPFEPRAVVANVCDILHFRAEEKGLLLRTVVDPTVPHRLQGDPTRLNQIVLNLAGNAVKFTEHGTVTIHVACGTEPVRSPDRITLVVSITDTGIGIPPDRLERIFEEFTQAYSDTTRKYGGTGLGLTISKRLTDLQGGTIAVTSEQGKGSTFTVSIPYSIAGGSGGDVPARAMDREPDPTALRDLRILLAEDNAFNAMVAQDELADAIPGARVEVAANGRIAVELVKANDYDLILMDVQMPEMNGYDATRAIRALPGDKGRIPIVAMTANVLKEEVERCREVGMNSYAPKPFKREELEAAIREAFRPTDLSQG